MAIVGLRLSIPVPLPLLLHINRTTRPLFLNPFPLYNIQKTRLSLFLPTPLHCDICHAQTLSSPLPLALNPFPLYNIQIPLYNIQKIRLFPFLFLFLFLSFPSSSSSSLSPASSSLSALDGYPDGYPDGYKSSAGSSSSGIGITVIVVIVVIVVSVVIFIVIFICVCRKVCKAFKKASPNNNGNDLEVGMGIRAYTTDQQRGNSLEGLVTYTLEDLVRATNNFKTKIGHGASGFVYLANLPGGRMGAVKRAKDLDLESFKEELSVLLRLPRHPHLVDLIGWCVQPDEKILVFEFICNGSLYDRLHKNKGGTSPLSWAARMDIASQLALALQYLHEKADPPILHRDIKSANVLLVNDNCVKLADFGLAKLGRKDNQSTFTAVRGSYGYMDPRYVKTRKYSAKSDVYSFGVLLLELITGLKSVHDDTPLAEWTETYRSQGIQKFMTIVDQNMIADHINIMELQNMMMIADRCLGEISKERPAMREIVNMMLNSNGNLSVDGVEAPFMRNGNVSDGGARNINSNGNLSDGG